MFDLWFFNTIMDGTYVCACVSPLEKNTVCLCGRTEFDAHEVNFDEMLMRLGLIKRRTNGKEQANALNDDKRRI